MEIEENEISYKIRGSIFNVYNNLGPGLLESAYEVSLRIELEKMGFDVTTLFNECGETNPDLVKFFTNLGCKFMN